MAIFRAIKVNSCALFEVYGFLFDFTHIVENVEEQTFCRNCYLVVVDLERVFESHSMKNCGFDNFGGG